MRTRFSEHRGPFESHQHTRDAAAGDVGHDDTQHPAHLGELGVDLCLAVRHLEHLHPPWAGLLAVPAVPAPAVPAARTGQ